MGKYIFSSGEAYLMAEKALLFGDQESLEKIVAIKDPKRQKALGRKVRGFEKGIWDDNKYQIMVKGLYLKFEQNPEIKKRLLATGDKVLVEGSPYDKIWGVGLHYGDDLILDEKNWLGENLLGKALMEVREML